MIELTWPTDQDPIQDSLHSGRHCLFYNPEFNRRFLDHQSTLVDLCIWANNHIVLQGITGFLQDSRNHDSIANLVKLNMWVHDIQQQGIVKPMLVWYFGADQYSSATGHSRLRAAERVPSITHVSAFISTNALYKSEFNELESITTMTRFAELCQAVPGQQFLFRLGNTDDPYGLDWFEYNSQHTTKVTPGDEWCISAIAKYLNRYPDTFFTPDWFDQQIDWTQ